MKEGERIKFLPQGGGVRNMPPPPPPTRGRAKWVPFVLLAFFPSFIAFFGPIWGESMQRGQLWCCDVHFRCFRGLGTPNPPFVLFGPENGLFKLPKHYSFKGKMANFEAQNTVKQGKKRQRDKWHFSRAHPPPPSSSERCLLAQKWRGGRRIKLSP